MQLHKIVGSFLVFIACLGTAAAGDTHGELPQFDGSGNVKLPSREVKAHYHEDGSVSLTGLRNKHVIEYMQLEDGSYALVEDGHIIKRYESKGAILRPLPLPGNKKAEQKPAKPEVY